MRHRCGGRKLGRNRGHRRGLFRNLLTALLLHDRIETTEAKGKVLRAIGDRMISLGLSGDLAARRRAIAYIQDRQAVSRLFSEVAPLFASPGSEGAPQRGGGYTRLIKTRLRHGDAAPMVIVEITRKADPQKTSAQTDEKKPDKTVTAA